MIQSLRQIKLRIRSIENAKKVTGALEMISVSKLNSTNKILSAQRQYFLKLRTMLNNLLASVEVPLSPYLKKKAFGEKTCLCVITSDSGLCGVYNNDIIRAAEAFINERKKDNVELVIVGRKGLNYFKNAPGVSIAKSYVGLNGRYSKNISDEITGNLVDLFSSGKVGEVYCAYAHFETALLHKPVVKKFLGLQGEGGVKSEYIFEPAAVRVLEELLPRYISLSGRFILLEAFASEHAARTVAMKTATDNARELLKNLVLTRNKVRQATITQDMLEIISSAEALKG
ncbi:MAG: ATP synthase F1 subunit gamma [Candidatus Omnitrophota bacterium]